MPSPAPKKRNTLASSQLHVALCKSALVVALATLLFQSVARDAGPLLRPALTSAGQPPLYPYLVGLVQCVSSSGADSSSLGDGDADQADGSPSDASYAEENDDDGSSSPQAAAGALGAGDPSLGGSAGAPEMASGPTNAVAEDDELPGQAGHAGTISRQRQFIIHRTHNSNNNNNAPATDNGDDSDYNTATTSAALQTPMAATRQPIASFFNEPLAPPMAHGHHHHHPHHAHMSAPAEMLNFFNDQHSASPFGSIQGGGATSNGQADNSNNQDPHSAMDDAVAVNGRHHQAAMNALFQRRQLSNQLQAGQELNPLALAVPGPQQPGGSPFGGMFGGGGAGGPHPKQASSNSLDSNGLGPGLPFGLGPGLAGIPGFHTPFDGPQRGDHSAHSNVQPVDAAPGGAGGPGSLSAPGAKVWPKIFRFTDGRINLSDFEKQKKIRLNSKNINNHLENQIDSSPVMFDGRPLRRKSFLILHGGIY